MIYISVAVVMLVITGCRTSSRYQPSCPPTVVSSAPVAPACPQPACAPQLPPPPPAPIVPR